MAPFLSNSISESIGIIREVLLALEPPSSKIVAPALTPGPELVSLIYSSVHVCQ